MTISQLEDGDVDGVYEYVIVDNGEYVIPVEVKTEENLRAKSLKVCHV